jgi:hypothetical protein
VTQIRFTTLANAKRYLALTAATDDGLVDRLILSATGFVRGWINREIAMASYTETYAGSGSHTQTVFNYPIISVQALTIDGQDIPEKTGFGAPGFTWRDYQVVTDGYRFNEGIDNVQVTYTAGYQMTEAKPIPATPDPAPNPDTTTYTITTTAVWATGVSVYVDGTLLTEVAADPADGEYTVAEGLYTFNVAQQGKTAIITYGHIPWEIEQATIDLVARKYRERDRVGLVSKGLAGETTAYSQSDLSADTKAMLNQYRQVVPV